MMWVRLDDALLGHPKILSAGESLGRLGPAVALGVYVAGILYANRHLTDGLLSVAAVRHIPCGTVVAPTLVSTGLWHQDGDGYRIHDYHEWNPRAADVRSKRAADRERKRNPDGIQPDSNGNPDGIQPDSARIPDASRACAPGRPLPRPIPTLPKEQESARLHSSHKNCASCGRVCVPSGLHARFKAAQGGDENEADQRLRDWYQIVHDRLAVQPGPIDSNGYRLWQREYDQRWGTSGVDAHEKKLADLLNPKNTAFHCSACGGIHSNTTGQCEKESA